MIRADFLTDPGGTLHGFHLVGHAGYGESGFDIVCAAVSSAAYLTVNTVTDVLSVTPLSLRVDEGDMLFRLEGRDAAACQVPLLGLKLHLIQLEEQYPQAVRVSYIEV